MAEPDRSTESVVELLGALDWEDIVADPFSVPGAQTVVEARAAAQPRALFVVSETADAAHLASVAYCREAPYLISWGQDTLALHESRRWVFAPGDAPLVEAKVDEEDRILDLLRLVRKTEVLADVGGGIKSAGERHPSLPDQLGEALARLRLRVADAQAFSGADIGSQDSAILAFFHQLLYMRVVEDRGDARPPDLIRAIVGDADPGQRLAALGGWYERNFDSELFEPSGVVADELPYSDLVELLRALVEPWSELKLDFSVTQAELAGRLYESYLATVPALDSGTDLRLFGSARVLDRRDAQASFYTPPGLAQAVTERTMDAFVHGRDVDPFDIRVLDPACGSGAFLLAAFRWLRSYAERKVGRELAAAERARLLLSCLHGADVDDRALALTRVQLLEEAQLSGQLPSLASNLFRGDAIARPPGAPDAAGLGIDWDAILQAKGPFSVVIGNPPFGSETKLTGKMSVASIRTLDRLYPEVRGFGRDYAYVFGALALRLLDEDGCAGLVMPRKLLDGMSGSKLRNLLATRGVAWLADLRAAGVFPGIKTRACVVVLGRPGIETTAISSVRDSREEASRALDDLIRPGNTYEVDRSVVMSSAGRGWSEFRLRWEQELRAELGAPLEPLAPSDSESRDVRFGTKPANVDKLVLGPHDWEKASRSRVRIGDIEFADRYAPLLVYASDLTPFSLARVERRLLLPFERDGRPTADAVVASELERRGGLPKNFQRGDLRTLLGPKVLLRAVTREPAAVADTSGKYLPIMRGALAIRADDLDEEGLEALACLLNSALYQWLLRGLGSPMQDEFVELSASDVRELPIPLLTGTAIKALCHHARSIRDALQATDRFLRASEYQRARNALDIEVFEMTEASPRIRSIVLDELIRDA